MFLFSDNRTFSCDHCGHSVIPKHEMVIIHNHLLHFVTIDLYNHVSLTELQYKIRYKKIKITEILRCRTLLFDMRVKTIFTVAFAYTRLSFTFKFGRPYHRHFAPVFLQIFPLMPKKLVCTIFFLKK